MSIWFKNALKGEGSLDKSHLPPLEDNEEDDDVFEDEKEGTSESRGPKSRLTSAIEDDALSGGNCQFSR